MKLLADNDALCYLACSSLEEIIFQLKEKDSVREEFDTLAAARRAMLEVDDPENHNIEVRQIAGDFTTYQQHWKLVLDNVMSATKSDTYRLYSEVPDSVTFRHKLAFSQPYKDRRDKPFRPRPVYLNKLKDWCVHNQNALSFTDIETDDALCIVQTDCLLRGEESIIAQNDKDILQCQGKHFRLHHKHRDILEVSGYGEPLSIKSNKLVGTGSKFFFGQVLTGDPTDTYPGLPNMGPVRAMKLLQDTTCYEEGLEVVIEAYKKVYGDDFEKYLLEQGRLAWMLRHKFDGKFNNIPLWDLTMRPQFG